MRDSHQEDTKELNDLLALVALWLALGVVGSLGGRRGLDTL